MIAISPLLFDPFGHITLHELPRSETGDVARRVNRVRTLDTAGVAINDRGFFDGDRTLQIRWRIQSRAQIDAVRRLVRLYARLNVSTREGVFIAAPESVRERNGEGELTLLVIERRA